MSHSCGLRQCRPIQYETGQGSILCRRPSAATLQVDMNERFLSSSSAFNGPLARLRSARSPRRRHAGFAKQEAEAIAIAITTTQTTPAHRNTSSDSGQPPETRMSNQPKAGGAALSAPDALDPDDHGRLVSRQRDRAARRSLPGFQAGRRGVRDCHGPDGPGARRSAPCQAHGLSRAAQAAARRPGSGG